MGGPALYPVYSIVESELLLGNLYDNAPSLSLEDELNRTTLRDAELSQPLSRDSDSALEYLTVSLDDSEHTIGLSHFAIPIDYYLTNLISLITKYVTRLVKQIKQVGY